MQDRKRDGRFWRQYYLDGDQHIESRRRWLARGRLWRRLGGRCGEINIASRRMSKISKLRLTCLRNAGEASGQNTGTEIYPLRNSNIIITPLQSSSPPAPTTPAPSAPAR